MLVSMTFDLARHIVQTRKALGWTQSELARRAGIDQGDLSRIESGQSDPRWSTVTRISTALGQSIAPEGRSTERRPLSVSSRDQVRRAAASTKVRPSEHAVLPVKH